MEKSTEVSFEIGKIYFFICLALPCGGKTTFFNKMIEIYDDYYKEINNDNIKKKFKVFYLSFDQMRADEAKELQASNPKMSKEVALEKTLKSTLKNFEENLSNICKAKESTKINIVLLDKNYPEGLEKFRKTFCKDITKNIIVLLTPKINKPIQSSLFKCPFSYDYIFQCYFRLKSRIDHEIFNYTSPDFKYTFLSYIKLYLNYSITNDLVPGVYHKEISCFSDETQKINPFEEIKEFFDNFIYKMKEFNYTKIDKYSDEIDMFFGLVEQQYESFFIETIDDIEKTVRKFYDKEVLE